MYDQTIESAVADQRVLDAELGHLDLIWRQGLPHEAGEWHDRFVSFWKYPYSFNVEILRGIGKQLKYKVNMIHSSRFF